MQTYFPSSSDVFDKTLERAAELKAGPYSRLSPRESQVFEMMGAGLTNAEIASRLSIGNRTVETHRHNIMGKLGIDSASGLIRTATQYDDIHSGIPAGPSTA